MGEQEQPGREVESITSQGDVAMAKVLDTGSLSCQILEKSYSCKASPEQITGEPLQHLLHVANALHALLKAWASQKHALDHLKAMHSILLPLLLPACFNSTTFIALGANRGPNRLSLSRKVSVTAADLSCTQHMQTLSKIDHL